MIELLKAIWEIAKAFAKMFWQLHKFNPPLFQAIGLITGVIGAIAGLPKLINWIKNNQP